MNKPTLQDKDKVATVYNSKGEVCETFSFRDHGNSYLSAAQNYLMQNYDKLMAEEVEQMNEVSGPLLGKYIVAARNKEKKEHENGKKFVQQMRDAGMEGFSAPLYHKGPHYGKASRENMIKLAVNKLTNPDLPVSDRVKVPATESVEQMDEAKWRDPKLKGKTFMNPRAVNRAPKDQSEYYGGDMNNPGELRGDEKIPLDREGKPKLSTDPLADRANLPKRTRGGQKFPRVGPLKQAIMNKEEVERLDELSLETLDKYKRAAAQSAKKADASGDYAKGHKRFKGIIQATKKQFKQDIMKEAKKDPREYGFEGDMAMSQLRSIMNHTQQLLGMLQPDMDLPEWVQLKITLAQDYIETAADYMQTELQKEEVEQVNEKLTKDMSAGKIISDFIHSDDPKFDGKSKDERKRMALGAYYSMHPEKSKNESIENKMYNNIIAKLEEGRGRPPKEGSEAWKRRQAASAAGETVDEMPALGFQLLKHRDQGERGSGMIKFKDGSSHKVSAQQRDKALRFMSSLLGAGKDPVARQEKIKNMSKSHDEFLQHIGEKPMRGPEKRHPMSAIPKEDPADEKRK